MRETNRKRGRKVAPRLEALEDRSLPSVTPLDVRPEGIEVVDTATEETKPDVPIDTGVGKGADETTVLTADDSSTDEFGGDVVQPNIYFLTRGDDAVQTLDGTVDASAPDEGAVPVFRPNIFFLPRGTEGTEDPNALDGTDLPSEASQRSLDGEEPVVKEEGPFAVPPTPEDANGPIYFNFFTTADADGAVPQKGDNSVIYQTMAPPPVSAPVVAAPEATLPSNDAAVANALTHDTRTVIVPEAKATLATTPTLREQTDGSTGYRGPATQAETPKTSDAAAPVAAESPSFTVEASF